MDTRRLSYFACILEEGSITPAAQRLRLSQPALTKAMKLLEDELGVVLFERSMAGIAPTTYGEALYSRAKAILSEIRSAEEEIATLRGMAGERFRIGALPTLTASVVAKAVNEVSRRFPDLQIRVQEGTTQSLFRAMRRRELDLCLVYAGNVVSEHGFETHVIFQDQLNVVASSQHPLVRRSSIQVVELEPYPWCAAVGGNWPLVERMLRSAGLDPPQPRVDPGGAVQFLKALVGASEYLSVLPSHAITGELARGELVVLPVEGISLQREIIALRPRETELPASGRALLAALSRAAPAVAALLQASA